MFAIFNLLHKVFNPFVLILTVLWLAACQTTLPGGQGPSINPSAPIPVALLVPHGAASANEQQLAQDLENAARMAVADLDGVKIDLRVYGTAGNAERAQQMALKAVADGAKIIIGPLHAESANAVAVAVAGKNVNVLTFSNNASVAGGNLFVLGQTFENTADRLIRFAAGQGKSRVLTVHSANLAGQLGKQAIERAIAANGITSAGTVSYEFSQKGVIAAISPIRTAASGNGADAIFFTANTAGALPLFTEMLPEAGVKPDTTQFIGLSRWDTPPQTLELPGVQGGWFALPDPQRSAQFRSRFQAAYGNTPHALSGLAYDGIAAVGALARTGERNALSREALTQPAGFQGVMGVFRLRADGTNERGLAVATIQEKQVVVISPAPSSFGGAGF